MTLRLKTFGAVYLERDGAPLGGAHAQRRRLAFLAYLAASGRANIPRAKLIAMLWPESDEAGGRHSLSQLLYSLRHDLGSDAIRIDAETVSLDHSTFGSDVHDFDQALKAGKLEDAVELYTGPFLDGFHIDAAPEMERWIDSERGSREMRAARSLERLAGDAEKTGDWHSAQEWWRGRVAIDPANGEIVLRFMKALSSIGDRQGALRAARVYETTVREDFEDEPERAVMEYAAALKHVSAENARTPQPPLVPLMAAAAEIHSAPEPATASEPAVVVASPSQPVKPVRSVWHWGLIAAVVAAVFAIVVAKPLREEFSDRPAAAGRATVLVGDLGGPDSVLSIAVREALRAQLANTKGIVVTSDLGIREVKTLMRLPNEPLQPANLLTVATRSGAHAAISGSVLPIGSGAQIVVDVINPQTGKVEATFAERPLDASGILKSAERLGRTLGSMISKTPRDTTVQPLPAVTTASLPALKSYALARQIAARGKRLEAVGHAERAVTHDSTFVLAHYLLGDLLWFIDEQSHSEAHLAKAYELRATVPVREQLMIHARYEQLVRDRPDSALVYWELLRDASPGDVLAYEGRTWALRALGRHEEAAAAADTAMLLDPAAVAPNTNNAMYSLLSVGDTAAALALTKRVVARNREAPLEARFFAAIERRDLRSAIAVADSSDIPFLRAWRRQMVHLARGDLAAARRDLDSLVLLNAAQSAPRALLNQGIGELAAGNPPAARAYARKTLEWIRKRDLSPPAIGRLSERTGVLAAMAGDKGTLTGVIDLVRQRDKGRKLRSYVLTGRTLDAALAYVRGDFATAARQAEEARHGVYFSRSLLTIVQLEAEARRRAGQVTAADSLNRLITTHQIVDGDFETWSVLKWSVAKKQE